MARVRSGWNDAVLVGCVAGVSFLNSFFSGALTVSLPTIQKDLHISTGNLQWSVSLYALVLGAFLLPAGRLADVFSHRRLFLIGTCLFSLISILVAVSPNWVAFTAFCALLGIGAACNTPAGVGVLGAHFDAGEAKNRAFATLGAGQPLGFISGLVLGAIMTDTKASWRASFYVQGALAACFALAGYFTVPASFAVALPSSNGGDISVPLDALALDGVALGAIQSRPRSININPSNNTRVDWIGIVLSVSGLILFTFALTDAQSEPKGWRTPFLPPLIPLSLIILAGFFYWQHHLEKKLSLFRENEIGGARPPPPPLLSPKIWRAPFMPIILAIVFSAWSGFNTSSYFINLIIQLVLKASPIRTALYFLPMIASGVVLNLVPGYLLGRVNGKIIIVTSMVLSLVGPILIACINPDAPYTHFLLPIMIFLPAPDLCYAIAAVQISRSVSRSEQATAGALFSVVTRLATAISLAILSTASNSASSAYLAKHPLDNVSENPDVLLAGYRIGGGWGCVGCVAVGLVLSVVGLKGMGVVGRKDEDMEPILGPEDVDDTRLTRRRTGASRRDTDSSTL